MKNVEEKIKIAITLIDCIESIASNIVYCGMHWHWQCNNHDWKWKNGNGISYQKEWWSTLEWVELEWFHNNNTNNINSILCSFLYMRPSHKYDWYKQVHRTLRNCQKYSKIGHSEWQPTNLSLLCRSKSHVTFWFLYLLNISMLSMTFVEYLCAKAVSVVVAPCTKAQYWRSHLSG